MLMCYNKILCDMRPAHQVFSADKMHWLNARVKNCGTWEDDLYVISFDN